ASEALSQHLPNADGIAVEQGLTVKPQAGENLRAIHALTVSRQELSRGKVEPMQLPFLDAQNQVFQHAGLLVVVALAVQVDRAGTGGDLRKEFRRSLKVFLGVYK